MDLFVINRHQETITAVNEQQNLEKMKKVIVANARKERQEKRNLKEKKGAVNEKHIKDHDFFVDKALCDPVVDNKNDEHINRKHKLDQCEIEGFTVLGVANFSKKAKVKRVLPKWLANPTVVSADLQNLTTKVSSIKDLDKKLKKKLKKSGVKYLFPVQAEVIPWLLQSYKHSDIVFPQDICVSAPTGSGKTLAFVIPVIQALMHHTIKKIRALVILPTQDLALQVFKTFKKYAQDTSLDICIITGKNLFENEQKQLLYKNEAFGYLSKVDILVCTAGRLVDHLKSTEGFDLTSLEFLVIDEADRVLDSIQHDWLYHLERHIHSEDSNLHFSRTLNLLSLKKQKPPQKLLFSATLSQDPEKLQKLSLFQPKLFTSVVETKVPALDDISKANSFIGKYTTPNELTEKYIVCSLDLKPLVLYEFIRLENLTKTMVFSHSVESTHRLAILLSALFKESRKVEEVSSNLDVKSRNKLIEDFSCGKIDILVCTDSLARGIDLPGVQCVISYSAPKHLKTYIHRAGRTARAGEPGLAVALLHKSQLNKFQSLMEQADKSNLEEVKISEENLEPLGDQYKQALEDLKKTVVTEEKRDLNKIKSAKRPKTKSKVMTKE